MKKKAQIFLGSGRAGVVEAASRGIAEERWKQMRNFAFFFLLNQGSQEKKNPPCCILIITSFEPVVMIS